MWNAARLLPLLPCPQSFSNRRSTPMNADAVPQNAPDQNLPLPVTVTSMRNVQNAMPSWNDLYRRSSAFIGGS
jgi:hypothetical protein